MEIFCNSDNLDATDSSENSSNNHKYNLESEVALYIKTQLKYSRVKIIDRDPFTQLQGIKVVELIGTRADASLKRYEKLALIYFILGILFVLLAVKLGYDNYKFSLTRLLFIIGIVTASACIFYIILSKLLNKESIWVEIQNIESKVNIEQADYALNRIKRIKASGNTKYRFREFVLISTNGFNDDAIELLIDNKVACYEKKDREYVKISRFEHITDYRN